MKPTLYLLLALTTLTCSAKAQGRGRGGGGMPAAFQEKIHELFADPTKIQRSIDVTETGYVAETTSSDPRLVSVLQTHVDQMSNRLAGGRPVRRWDPAFEEFSAHYEKLDHRFTKLDHGIRAAVSSDSKEAAKAAKNHAYIILDFSSQGDAQKHQPHRTALDEDGGQQGRFHGGPPNARQAALATTFGARAESATDRLIKTLGGQLQATLKAGGPETAITVCKEAAIPLTKSAADDFDGLTLTRVSDRLRNPKNAPDKMDRKVLDHFRKSAAERKIVAHLTTMPDGQTQRYYRPLFVSETCLKCHGDPEKMSGELRSLLKEHYPEDQATGYRAGELRGLIRVERKAPAQE